MDNDNHWSMYFENVKMSSTNDMNLDVVGVDFTLISQIQEQINLWTQVATMTILCMIEYGLNVLCLLTETNNVIPEVIPQKERRRQELMSYLVHTERCRDMIRMSPEAFINLCQRIRGTWMLKMHSHLQLKNKWLNFYTSLVITSRIEVFLLLSSVRGNSVS